jgi:hypothetical protein
MPHFSVINLRLLDVGPGLHLLGVDAATVRWACDTEELILSSTKNQI